MPQNYNAGYSVPKLSQMQYVHTSLLSGKWIVQLFVSCLTLIFFKQEISTINFGQLSY